MFLANKSYNGASKNFMYVYVYSYICLFTLYMFHSITQGNFSSLLIKSI